MDPPKLCWTCVSMSKPPEVCPHAELPEPAGVEGQLPARTVLRDRYLIGGPLGRGGFSITYLAWDSRLQRPRAIKEFFPIGVVTRDAAQRDISVVTGQRESFTEGIDRYLTEARLLARFEGHPSIVSPLDFFEENGTAYLVMEYLEGETLRSYVTRQGDRIPFEHARYFLGPVLRALASVHEAGILHRDVSPDNVFLTVQGQGKLLDFGAARAPRSTASETMTVILREHYAPPEQYTRSGAQGTWTDVYAGAATYYFALTGQAPQSALERLLDDQLEDPSALGVKIPHEAEDVLMRALRLRPERRPQRIEELLHALGDTEAGGEASAAGAAAEHASPATDRGLTAGGPGRVRGTTRAPTRSGPARGRVRRLTIGCSIAAALIAAGWGMQAALRDDTRPATLTASAPATAPPEPAPEASATPQVDAHEPMETPEAVTTQPPAGAATPLVADLEASPATANEPPPDPEPAPAGEPAALAEASVPVARADARTPAARPDPADSQRAGESITAAAGPSDSADPSRAVFGTEWSRPIRDPVEAIPDPAAAAPEQTGSNTPAPPAPPPQRSPTPRAARRANLAIVSNVSGAEVLIDGTRQGMLRDAPYELSEGEHTVIVRKPGYEEFAERVQLSTASPEATLYAALNPRSPTTAAPKTGAAAMATAYQEGLRRLDSRQRAEQKAGLEIVELAGQGGLLAAQEKLGGLYIEGLPGVVAPSDPEALRWYRKAAEQPQAARAQLTLARRLELGRWQETATVESERPGTACRFLRVGCPDRSPAAAQVFDPETEFIPWLKSQSPGRGTPEELFEAVGIYRRLAQRGNAEAFERLGYMLSAGHGTPPDRFEAFLWLLRAAREGRTPAQYVTAKLYLLGEGCVQNPPAGQCWLQKSAAQSDAARRALEGLSPPVAAGPAPARCDFPPYE